MALKLKGRPRLHTKCKIDGCTGKGTVREGAPETFKRGYCQAHYIRFKKYGDHNHLLRRPKGDNLRQHPLYSLWINIKDRTSNPKSTSYKNYGARGIKVCDRWLGPEGFLNFVADMGVRPNRHSIDRLDVNGDYTPENCRWANYHVQGANRRNNNKCVGVSWDKRSSKWVTSIMVDGKKHLLGYFNIEEDAIKARKEGERRLGIQYSL